MKNEALYNKTVSILVDAYFNDTLEHTNCHACAVGNLVAANLKIKMIIDTDGEVVWDKGWSNWDDVFCSNIDNMWQDIDVSAYKEDAKVEIDSTGYKWWELAQIEKSFEFAPKGNEDNEDEWMFNGLMAVIDILDVIHQNNDKELTVQSKNKFIKKTV